MAKLTYWYCECLEDSSAYNIRTKTKKEAVAVRESYYETDGYYAYSEPRKHTIYYRNAFDLMDTCLSEARGNE